MLPKSIYRRGSIHIKKHCAGMSLALVLLLAFSLSAVAKPAPVPTVSGHKSAKDSVSSHCTEEDRDGRHARFDLPPIERMRGCFRSTGDMIFGFSSIKDGSGTALILWRDNRDRPFIEVRARSRHVRRPVVVAVRTRIAQSVWNDLAAKGRSLDFTEYAVDQVCTAGGVWTIEVMDSEGLVRRVYHHPCYDDQAIQLFDKMANAAMAALPKCSSRPNYEGEKSESMLHRCLLPRSKRGRWADGR